MSQELIISDTGVLARAELDVQISTAKAFPRNVKASIDYAEELATMDEVTAQSCYFCVPRKDAEGHRKEIKGGSIRLAEIIASAWGNLHAATRIVENDGRHVTAEACAWDLQKNVKITVQNKISIWFGQKGGKAGYQASADMQTTLSNAAASKALRNAIFKVVPKALVDRVLEKAMRFQVGQTIEEVKNKTVNPEKVSELVKKLTGMGVDSEKMLAYYEIQNESQITQDIFVSLRGVGTAITEGHIKAVEVFDFDDTSHLSAIEKISNLIHSKKQNEVENEAIETSDNDNGGQSHRFFK